MSGPLHIGIDAGSKTVKVVVMDEERNLLFSLYDRHLSNVRETLAYALHRTQRRFPDATVTLGITGSAGIKIAEQAGVEFIQEVVASKIAVQAFVPDADVVIELGGEDSKILFLTGGEELRMNSACAGGTGGFIDNIAAMMDINAEKLNVLAHGCEVIYPIASRCAVFAQSDVRPLLNEGVSKSDIAGSVFRAVALQCVTGLACGRAIKGKIAFLGGPLFFLSSLRQHFQDVIHIQPEDAIVPPEAHLLVAQGAALSGWNSEALSLQEAVERFKSLDESLDEGLGRLDALFESEEEYLRFKERHDRVSAPRSRLSVYEGPAYLGIDAGSTSIKCTLINPQKEILYSYYKRSAGDLLEVARDMFLDLHKHLPRNPLGEQTITIASAVSTGYGESFLQSAFRVDGGEIETVAHLRAALEIEPLVDSILDIGGQDIKFMRVRDGLPDEVVLNEACSSGCGSLLSGFAWSFNTKLKDFIAEAIKAEKPVDLGTRCTVFMTSRVRHAQKEGASLGDISAGLAYSVVKNALYKVIRIPDLSLLGKTVMVQGGAFKNDAVLRAFEKLSGRTVIRPEISEYMGAYGAALFALERAQEGAVSTLLDADACKSLRSRQQTTRCRLCNNNCLLTINRFGSEEDGYERTFVMGNRCERGAGKKQKRHLPNLYTARYERIFQPVEQACLQPAKGRIGLMRALTMYEEYPFWATFFACLGYETVLSDPSSRTLFAEGIETIPSESACYPEKIAHGHARNLIAKGVDALFAPREMHGAQGNLNCPVYANYPTALAAGIDELADGQCVLLAPYLDRVSEEPQGSLAAELYAMFAPLGTQPDEKEIEPAIGRGMEALRAFKRDMLALGAAALGQLHETGGQGILLAGRPYHCDPEFNHAIPEMIESFGFAVFTIDALLADEDFPACGQSSRWEYTARMYAAAEHVAQSEALEMVQLYSFGCGIDAISSDRTREILHQGGKAFAALKVDEMSDVATARIRIRSMLAATHVATSAHKKRPIARLCARYPQAMPGKLLGVQWAQECFRLIEPLFSEHGPKPTMLESNDPALIQKALSYANNDSCFVSVIATGEVVCALQGGLASPGEDIGIIAPHTCMHCFSEDMREQLSNVAGSFGLEGVPVYPDIGFFDELVTQHQVYDEAFSQKAACHFVLYDLVHQITRRLRPYGALPDEEGMLGELACVVRENRLWEDPERFKEAVGGSFAEALSALAGQERKTLVGVTGLLPPVFCRAMNDGLVEMLEREGCEVAAAALTDYLCYGLEVLGKESAFTEALRRWRAVAAQLLESFDCGFLPVFDSCEGYVPAFHDRRDLHGMGWLFSRHVETYAQNNIDAVIFSQTFACLPGHCLGRGVFKRIKRSHPDMALISLEYDPGVSGVNRENRIKLLTTIAKRKKEGRPWTPPRN